MFLRDTGYGSGYGGPMRGWDLVMAVALRPSSKCGVMSSSYLPGFLAYTEAFFSKRQSFRDTGGYL